MEKDFNGFVGRWTLKKTGELSYTLVDEASTRICRVDYVNSERGWEIYGPPKHLAAEDLERLHLIVEQLNWGWDQAGA